jgi:hypothetical protein
MTNLPMKIICINDKHKPKEIPIEKWIKYGEMYTLIGVQHLLSSDKLGFELAEIKLGEDCFPYHYFDPNRFAPIDEASMEHMESEIYDLVHPTTA